MHPDVEAVRSGCRFVEAFHLIDDPAEAELQIGHATRHVRAVTGHEAAGLFAYPYGQRSGYIVYDYLPNQTDCIAAFTTDPAPVRADTDRWQIPRFVCHRDWTSAAELRRLLAGS